MNEVRGKTLCARLVGDVMLVVHGMGNPDADEWRRYCEMAGATRKARGGLRTLVITEGSAAPNAAQRAIYKEEVGSRNAKVAVLTENTAARTVLTAMSWFNSDMKAFGLRDQAGALAFLGVTDTAELPAALADFRAHLGLRAGRGATG